MIEILASKPAILLNILSDYTLFDSHWLLTEMCTSLNIKKLFLFMLLENILEEETDESCGKEEGGGMGCTETALHWTTINKCIVNVF